MNILFNMRNSKVDYSIFSMYLKFAKEMGEPQKFNKANKETNNRSIYPRTREFIDLLDQLDFKGTKRDLLMIEWENRMDPKNSDPINAHITNSTNTGELPNGFVEAANNRISHVSFS